MTMKVRVIRTCMIQGQHAAAGDVLDLDERTAQGLLTIRRVEKVAVKETAPVPVVEQRDPVVESRDPDPVAKPKRGRPPRV